MELLTILKRIKKELLRKLITSIFIQGLLLIIPVYWANAINKATDLDYHAAFELLIITMLLTLFYYFWSYLNQRAWYKFYNKIYLECTNMVTDANVDDISLGEYTNIINNDIDIIGTFLGNGVTRFIQILEFLVIYIYFFKVDIYIFAITLGVSILMITIILYFGSKIEIQNKDRKDNLDYKTINIHNIYDVLKSNKHVNDKRFIKSTIAYLESNAKFNVFVNMMTYIILSFIELCRYGIIIYAVYLVSIGKMEIGTVLLIYSYYAKIITNFEVLGTINAEYRSVIVSAKRLNKIRTNKEL